MPGFAAAAAVTGAVGLISSFIGSKKASKAAREQAALEAKHEGLITTERQRQINKEERALYGETLAGYAGGGVLIGQGGQDRPPTPQGSVGSVIGEQRREFGFERAITGKVGATKVQQALAGGKATADAYKYQGYANVATGISSILANFKG
jgi:hypothetical protein